MEAMFGGQYIITGIMGIYKNCNNSQCEFHMIGLTDTTTTNDNCNDYTNYNYHNYNDYTTLGKCIHASLSAWPLCVLVQLLHVLATFSNKLNDRLDWMTNRPSNPNAHLTYLALITFCSSILAHNFNSFPCLSACWSNFTFWAYIKADKTLWKWCSFLSHSQAILMHFEFWILST